MEPGQPLDAGRGIPLTHKSPAVDRTIRWPAFTRSIMALATRLPAGIQLAARQLRVGWMRRLPMLYGQMARRLVPDELVRRWTEPVLTDPDIRRDLLAYCRGRFDKAALIADTEALRHFQGDALVLWSPDNRVMPPAHGCRLAALMPRARYAEIPGAYVLSALDEPEAVARAMGAFLVHAPAAESRSCKS